MTDEEIHNVYIHMTGKAEGIHEMGGDVDFAVLFARAIIKIERDACLAIQHRLHAMNFGGSRTYTEQELLDHMQQGIKDYAAAIRARGKE